MIVYLFLLCIVCMIIATYLFHTDIFLDLSFVEIMVICMVVLTLLYMFIPVFKTIGNVVKTETYYANIASIRSQDSVSGSFMLGCGSIGSRQYYIYMEKCERYYKQGKLPVEICRIYENQELSPRIEWDEVTRTLPWWMSFGFDCLDNRKEREGDWRIIVPTNTIIHSYQIN